jgi:hypothetical protein
MNVKVQNTHLPIGKQASEYETLEKYKSPWPSSEED